MKAEDIVDFIRMIFYFFVYLVVSRGHHKIRVKGFGFRV